VFTWFAYRDRDGGGNVTAIDRLSTVVNRALGGLGTAIPPTSIRWIPNESLTPCLNRAAGGSGCATAQEAPRADHVYHRQRLANKPVINGCEKVD